MTLSNAAFNEQDVTISESYELKLGDDVAISKTEIGWQKLENGNMIYRAETTTAGYKVEDNKISYVATAVEGKTLAEFSGINVSIDSGAGAEIIGDYNFVDGDLLQILDKNGKEISKDATKKRAFDVNDLTLSIKDSGKVILIDVGTKAKININRTELYL